MLVKLRLGARARNYKASRDRVLEARNSEDKGITRIG